MKPPSSPAFEKPGCRRSETATSERAILASLAEGARRRPFFATSRRFPQVSRLEAGAVVGLDADEADHALLDLAPGALQGRADVLGLFDVFGVAAKGLGHLVVAGVAEVAAGLVALRVGGPAAIEADHTQRAAICA